MYKLILAATALPLIAAAPLPAPAPAIPPPALVAALRDDALINDHIAWDITEGLTTEVGQRLAGNHVLVTAGPTHEAIDPVRYLANRSSGKQGFALAGALAALGARVTLVAGPVALPTPRGVTRIDIVTALDMTGAVAAALPADAAICVAAVADWRVDATDRKLPKAAVSPVLTLIPNPDILAMLAARGPSRPPLVVGFAAETHDVATNAVAKRLRKGADWIVANDVSGDVMGGDRNAVHLVTAAGVEDWPDLPKQDVADRLATRVAAFFGIAQ